MKSPRILGHMLEVCLLFLAIALFIVPSGAYLPYSPDASSLSIQLQNKSDVRSSLDSSALAEVSDLVALAYTTADERSSDAVLLRNALAGQYGADFSESAAPPVYHLEWDPVNERYVVVCTGTTTFAVDFSSGETVLVVLAQNTLLR